MTVGQTRLARCTEYLYAKCQMRIIRGGLTAFALSWMLILYHPIMAQYDYIDRRLTAIESVNADRRLSVLESRLDGIESVGHAIMVGVGIQLILTGLAFKRSERGPHRATDPTEE